MEEKDRNWRRRVMVTSAISLDIAGGADHIEGGCGLCNSEVSMLWTIK